MPDFTVYNVHEDGKLEEVDPTNFVATSKDVLIIIDRENNKAILWRGLEANVRKKFAGAQAFNHKKKEAGDNPQVIEAEGDEFDITQYVKKE